MLLLRVLIFHLSVSPVCLAGPIDDAYDELIQSIVRHRGEVPSVEKRVMEEKIKSAESNRQKQLDQTVQSMVDSHNQSVERQPDPGGDSVDLFDGVRTANGDAVPEARPRAPSGALKRSGGVGSSSGTSERSPPPNSELRPVDVVEFPKN